MQPQPSINYLEESDKGQGQHKLEENPVLSQDQSSFGTFAKISSTTQNFALCERNSKCIIGLLHRHSKRRCWEWAAFTSTYSIPPRIPMWFINSFGGITKFPSFILKWSRHCKIEITGAKIQHALNFRSGVPGQLDLFLLWQQPKVKLLWHRSHRKNLAQNSALNWNAFPPIPHKGWRPCLRGINTPTWSLGCLL